MYREASKITALCVSQTIKQAEFYQGIRQPAQLRKQLQIGLKRRFQQLTACIQQTGV